MWTAAAAIGATAKSSARLRRSDTASEGRFCPAIQIEVRPINRRFAYWPRSHRNTAMSITCHELAVRIEQLHPEATPADVARLCLLLANYVDDLEQLADRDAFWRLWQEVGMRLQAATDQHAAMTEELDNLARSNPTNFNMKHIWVLIRAIKVQSQILQLYVGRPPLPL